MTSRPDYIVNGIALWEIEQAYPTSSCLPYNPDGKLFEMEAIAEDAEGNRYAVQWIFEDNGEENYDEYDYSNPTDCRLLETEDD